VTTLEAFVRESPVLAAVAGTIGAILLLLMLGALISNRRQKRRPAPVPPPHREPDLYTTAPDLAAAAYLDDLPVRAPEPPVVVRHGFSLAALTIAFVLGIVVGIGAMTTSREQIASALASLVAVIDPPAGGPVSAAVPAAADPPKPVEAAGSVDQGPAPAEAASGPPPEILARLSSLAARLEASLPRPAGPDMTLTSVAVDGATLRLGYAVGRAMPESESKAFDAYVERTARSLFCADESAELNSLNTNGVVFEMQYADPDGKTVTKLTVDQDFCP
jgi:hypothetical protein